MKLHIVARFVDGPVSIASVGGLDVSEKIWVTYAGNGKFAVRVDPPQGDLFKENLYDSPEAALDAVKLHYSN